MLHCRRKNPKWLQTSFVLLFLQHCGFFPSRHTHHTFISTESSSCLHLKSCQQHKNTPTLIFLLRHPQPCHSIPHRCDLRNSSVIQMWLGECWVPQSGWAGNRLQPRIHIFWWFKNHNQMMSLWAAASNHVLHRKQSLSYYWEMLSHFFILCS